MSDLPTSREPLRASKTMGFVYFITMEPDEFVKIGWALNCAERRMAELQTGCPHPLRLMAYAPGTLDEEKYLHRLFAEQRYRGEWFYNTGPITKLIERLCDDYPRPTNTCAPRDTFLLQMMAVTHPDLIPA